MLSHKHLARIRLAALGLALTGAPALAAAEFYVVLGSFNTESGQAAFEAGEKLMKRGRRCGFDVWTEHSSKIRGFTPGYYLALTGPYPAAAAAESMRARLLPCAPEAYVKAGAHLGE